MAMGSDAGGQGSNIDRFDRCFDAHFDQVLAFALRRCVNRDDAEDVAAETFATAWRRVDRLPDCELPWLLGIANRVIRNQQRSSRRRLRLAGKLQTTQTHTRGRDHAELVGERDAAARALSRLSDAHRELLQLIAWEGLSNEDAAAVLGCSNAALRVRLHRARRAMEKQLALAGHGSGQAHETNPEPREAR